MVGKRWMKCVERLEHALDALGDHQSRAFGGGAGDATLAVQTNGRVELPRDELDLRPKLLHAPEVVELFGFARPTAQLFKVSAVVRLRLRIDYFETGKSSCTPADQAVVQRGSSARWGQSRISAAFNRCRNSAMGSTSSGPSRSRALPM